MDPSKKANCEVALKKNRCEGWKHGEMRDLTLGTETRPKEGGGRNCRALIGIGASRKGSRDTVNNRGILANSLGSYLVATCRRGSAEEEVQFGKGWKCGRCRNQPRGQKSQMYERVTDAPLVDVSATSLYEGARPKEIRTAKEGRNRKEGVYLTSPGQGFLRRRAGRRGEGYRKSQSVQENKGGNGPECREGWMVGEGSNFFMFC